MDAIASTMLSQIEEGFVKRRSKRRVKDLSDATRKEELSGWLVLRGDGGEGCESRFIGKPWGLIGQLSCLVLWQ
eukprot:Skav204537  [mRNA]  locus=scaffold1211:214092:214574:- [translate_table: standard]